MGQWGAHFILDTYSHHLKVGKRKDVRVKIGPALDLSQYGSDIEDRQKVRECTAEIMSAITRLVEDLRGEKAPRPLRHALRTAPRVKGKIGVRKPDPQN